MDGLDIIVFGNKGENCLSELKLSSNWVVNLLSCDDLDAPCRSADATTLITFFDDNVDQKSLYRMLTTNTRFNGYQIRMCFFCVPPKSIDSELPLLFDDFMFYPCVADEFTLRLAVLERQLAPSKTNHRSLTIDTQSVLEEFASLDLRGNSEVFAHTLMLIKQTSKCDASVVIEGETGTGKENAARAIHYLGKRKDNAFVPINCGAIPDNLLESELFGHEKGAFTDANRKQQGLVALANDGTLFLDEVDSLSPKAQAALLRFLQTGEYRPLGSSVTLRSNVRIIAATNASLEEQVKRKAFREDLYFRLNVLYVRMPPLRERPEDITIIVENLIRKYRIQYERGPNRIELPSLRTLQHRAWPGNVRELENVILREFLLSASEQIVIMDDHVPDNRQPPLKNNETPTEPPKFQIAKEEAINKFESAYLQHLLLLTSGNITEAAHLAGKERRCLGKLIKKYNIDKSQFISHSTMV